MSPSKIYILITEIQIPSKYPTQMIINEKKSTTKQGTTTRQPTPTKLSIKTTTKSRRTLADSDESETENDESKDNENIDHSSDYKQLEKNLERVLIFTIHFQNWWYFQFN